MPRSKQGLVWRFLEKEKALLQAAKGPVTVGTWTVPSNTFTTNDTAMTDWRDYIFTTTNTSTTPTINIEWTSSGMIGSIDAK